MSVYVHTSTSIISCIRGVCSIYYILGVSFCPPQTSSALRVVCPLFMPQHWRMYPSLRTSNGDTIFRRVCTTTYRRRNVEHDKASNRGTHYPQKKLSRIDYQVVVKRRLRSTFVVSFSILTACLIGDTGKGIDNLDIQPHALWTCTW